VDGIKNRPKKLAKTNIVIIRRHDSSTVWLDHAATDPNERFRHFVTENRPRNTLVYRTSPDGVHWSEPVAMRAAVGDRTTVFYNPFRKVWVLSERWSGGWTHGRARAYIEDPDPKKIVSNVSQRVNWCAGEDADPDNPDPRFRQFAPELYNLDATPYESLMLGLFTICTGPGNQQEFRRVGQKRNDILLGFSRDGFHWHRPCRERFMAASWKDDTWNFGNVQSAAGGCLIVRDKLYFYVSARAQDPALSHGNGSTGLAILRRDGFASMDAGSQGGTLTTRPLTFKGKHLFVNVDGPKGELKAEVIDKDGKVIEPFSLRNCQRVSCDKTLAAVTWKQAVDLSAVSGKPVRFRFHLTNAAMYAFWVSPDRSGASHGFVAAGGPSFTGPTDTVGRLR